MDNKIETLLKHPKIAALKYAYQHPKHHPEGNTYNHTMQVTAWATAIAKELGFSKDDVYLSGVMGIAHDIGKVSATKYRDDKGKYTAYGHELPKHLTESGFDEFIAAAELSAENQRLVIAVIRWHMTVPGRPYGFGRRTPAKVAAYLRENKVDVARFIKFMPVIWLADHEGRKFYQPNLGDMLLDEDPNATAAGYQYDWDSGYYESYETNIVNNYNHPGINQYGEALLKIKEEA